MKIVICPLVSRDVPKATRAVNSIRNLFQTETIQFELVAIVNSLNEEFVKEFTTWCQKEGVEYRITISKGTPAAGKNQCLEFFRTSEYDGMCMLDGDDMYYPTASQQIERHLLHHPGTDLLIVKPSDQVISCQPDEANIGTNIKATCWSDNIVLMNYLYGPTQHSLFKDRFTATNLGGHVFYSRKFANIMKYDEEQILGEDLLLEFEALKLHQQRKICFWLSFASDVQFLDRTETNNIQSERNQEDGDFYYDRLVQKINTFLNINRSSFNELPVEFPEMIFSYNEKIEWIKQCLLN